MMSSWIMLAAPVAGLAAEVVGHVAAFRLCRRLGMLKSECAGFLVGAGHGGTILWGTMLGALPVGQTACFLLANLAIYGALGYGYFHFVNLGETARRVRLLRELLDAGGQLTDKVCSNATTARQSSASG